MDVRQNAVIDILLILVFSLSLFICGKVSADTGWQSCGDFQGLSFYADYGNMKKTLDKYNV